MHIIVAAMDRLREMDIYRSWEVLRKAMEDHDAYLDLATVWLMLAATAILGIVNILTWFLMAHANDRTSLGPALRRKKLAEGLAELGFATLFGMSLWAYYVQGTFGAYYMQDTFDVVTRTALRGGLSLSCLLAAAAGISFIRNLVNPKKEADHGPSPSR